MKIIILLVIVALSGCAGRYHGPRLNPTPPAIHRR